MMRVRAGNWYVYIPVLLDQIDAKTSLRPGDIVQVVNLPGCPRANTMRHCHVEHEGEFVGLVHTDSLSPAHEGRRK